jgi:hypothetical protein
MLEVPAILAARGIDGIISKEFALCSPNQHSSALHLHLCHEIVLIYRYKK